MLLALAPPALAQVSFSGPTNFPADQAPRSVAVGDFNADSDPDLAVANVARLTSGLGSVRQAHAGRAGGWAHV